jgi:hypothetical protein
VTIATQGDSGSRPVPADAEYEPAPQMASDLLTGRRLAGAQQWRIKHDSFRVIARNGRRAVSEARGKRCCRSIYLQTGWPLTTAIFIPGGHPFGCG